ncbi:MAG TPA: hypothetical protein VG734_24020 [Lacunisphaera sp.]|nr:hypothetical protein [Lacunisphaera sp.]
MIDTLLADWSPIAVVTKLVWLVQFALVIHVFKTGRPYWWFWILLAAPVVGGLAYIFIELLPETQANGGFVLWKPRAWRIRELEAELEETDTVKLRLRLAAELLAAGKSAEACAVAEPSLAGAFRDDPHTLANVARYRLEAGKFTEALAALDKVKIEADRMLGTEVAFLRGWALVLAGRHAEAQPILRSIDSVLLGEQPRYFLALSLDQSGARPDARAIWQDIRKRFRRASPTWRRAEKRWFKLAGERLKESG